MAASGKTYLRNAANDAWISVAVGSGSSGGSGGGSSFDTNAYMTLSGDMAITGGVYTKITFDTIVFDGNSECSAVTNSWTCATTGYYNISISIAPLFTYTYTVRVSLYVDGVSTIVGTARTGINGFYCTSTINMPNFYVTSGQVLTVYAYTSNNTSIASATVCTWFRVTRYK